MTCTPHWPDNPVTLRNLKPLSEDPETDPWTLSEGAEINFTPMERSVLTYTPEGISTNKLAALFARCFVLSNALPNRLTIARFRPRAGAVTFPSPVSFATKVSFFVNCGFPKSHPTRETRCRNHIVLNLHSS